MEKEKGKIVIVPFPFTDLSTYKVRPCLILHNSPKGEDFLVAFISSVIDRKIGKFDILVKANPRNGLRMDSVIKINKIATLEKKSVIGEIGSLETETLHLVDKKLKELFKLK